MADPNTNPSIAPANVQAALNANQPAMPSPPAGGGVLQSPMFDPGMIAKAVQAVSALPQYQQPIQQLQDIQSQEQGIQGQMASMQLPKMGPQIQHGAGFLHNLGQALLMAAGAAGGGPGRSLVNEVYAPGVRQYVGQRQQLADQLKALQEQEGIPKEELGATSQMANAAGNMAYRSAMTGIRQEDVDVKKQRADTAAQAVSQRYSVELQRLQQGAQKLDQNAQNLAIKKWFDAGVLEAMNSRIAAGQDENSARIQANEDMKSALSQNQWAVQHPIMNMLGMSPDIQAAPGAQPTAPAKPAAKPAGGSGGSHLYFDSQGNPTSKPTKK